jgi:hypothetical protein
VTADSLLAVSIGISTGLAVAVVALGLALLVVVTRNRGNVTDVEELRVQVVALRQEIEAQRAEFAEAVEVLKEFSRD